jgi:hypothetical protein
MASRTSEARDGEVVAERTLRNADELSEVMRNTFKVMPPVPAEEIFERAGG